ncbi:MAG: SixA phosphatase family protein [Gammaproteobacteria bacterium]
MQRRLILLRHAKSSWDNPNLRDFDRPLNKRGQRDAPSMGVLLKNNDIRPDVIISSDAKRAQTTARLVAAEIGYPDDDIRLNNALYLSSPNTMLDVLASEAANDKNVMLVAHNPGMTDLANYLSDARIDNLPTCGVFMVTQDNDNWQQMANREGKFEAFYCPKKDLNFE